LILIVAGRFCLRPVLPELADIFLIIEVADSTLNFDLTDKRALYANAGIAEYWVIEVKAKKLTRFVQGGVEQLGSGASISPAAFPEVRVELAELFG
jgi:Uma2 family endonuclease